MEEKKPPSSESIITESGGAVEEDDLVFPGFRFHPTDQELVGFYLTRKVEKKGFCIDIIKEIDIYKYDPWDLPNETRHVVQGAGDKQDWYFFCLRGRKYRNSIRPNRVTGSGFWKATGIDKPIHDGGAGECVGLKKSLVYYRGSAGRGTKTDWMMHEFRLPSTASSDLQDAEIWTICRIFKRNMSCNRRCQQQKQQQQQHASSKRSHQQEQQQQLQYYYDYRYHHQQRAASMTNEAYAATGHHQQPFMLHGFHGGVSSSAAIAAAATTTTASGSMRAPLPQSTTMPAWSELTTMRDSRSTWDELGRIMEI